MSLRAGDVPDCTLPGEGKEPGVDPDGSRHWPVVGFQRWAAIHPVRQFQFIQVSRSVIEARCSAEASPSAADEARLVAVIREQLGYPFEIRCEWTTGRLETGPGGKFEEFVRRPEVS